MLRTLCFGLQRAPDDREGRHGGHVGDTPEPAHHPKVGCLHAFEPEVPHGHVVVLSARLLVDELPVPRPVPHGAPKGSWECPSRQGRQPIVLHPTRDLAEIGSGRSVRRAWRAGDLKAIDERPRVVTDDHRIGRPREVTLLPGADLDLFLRQWSGRRGASTRGGLIVRKSASERSSCPIASNFSSGNSGRLSRGFPPAVIAAPLLC